MTPSPGDAPVTPEAVGGAILDERLDVRRGNIDLDGKSVTLKEALRIIASSAIGEDKEVASCLGQLRDLVVGDPLPVPVVVSAPADSLEAVFLEYETLIEHPRVTFWYSYFARSIALLADGGCVQVVTVRSEDGSLLRVDLMFAVLRSDGPECLLIDSLSLCGYVMDETLSNAVLEWAREAARTSGRPLLATEDFLREVDSGAWRSLTHQRVGSIASERITVSMPDMIRDFELSNLCPTDITAYFV